LRLPELHGRWLAGVAVAGAAAFTGLVFVTGIPARTAGQPSPIAVTGRLPAITILPSKGASSKLDLSTARLIAHDLVPGLRPQRAVVAAPSGSLRLTDVAAKVGLDFRQDDFRFGVVPSDVHSMMGGGLCWLDYNNDGWLDLFVVNSYSDNDTTTWNARGGLPR